MVTPWRAAAQRDARRARRWLLVLAVLLTGFWLAIVAVSAYMIAFEIRRRDFDDAVVTGVLLALVTLCVVVTSLAGRIEARHLRRLTRDLEAAYHDANERARTDPLTGVFSHGEGMLFLEQEARRSVRYQHPLSVLFIDVNGLKKVNDTRGHLMGDKVLKGLGALLIKGLRSVDMPFRYGGDEFVVVLPETDMSEAMGVARRLREQAGEAPQALGLPAGLSLDFSVGVASFPYHEATAPDARPSVPATVAALLQAADQALYQAKAKGTGVGNQTGTPKGQLPLVADEPLTPSSAQPFDQLKAKGPAS